MASIEYHADTGLFTRILPQSMVGRIAGGNSGNGYIQICIHYEVYFAHRLAWLYMTGRWPEKFIDHKDGDRMNNRWDNLREATPQQNIFNTKKSISNASGFKGVSWHRGARRWRAQIKIDGKPFHLGFYANPEDAHAAYMRKAIEARGEFARAS